MFYYYETLLKLTFPFYSIMCKLLKCIFIPQNLEKQLTSIIIRAALLIQGITMTVAFTRQLLIDAFFSQSN